LLFFVLCAVVPAQTAAAQGVIRPTAGFGVVFSDVDEDGSTSVELLDVDGNQLAKLTAPVRSDRRGVSFVGMVFREPVIHRVRIVSGNAPISANEVDVTQGGRHDLVVMDDFLYGEPRAIGN
jgi:hypothetical protein